MTWGFFFAAAFNVFGVLGTTRGFTANPIAPLYPGLFGWEGMALIVVWGLAYASVATRWRQVPALIMVFTLEKAIYVATFALWWTNPASPTFAALRNQHPDAVLFLSTYGFGDLAFFMMFAYAAWRAWRPR